MLSKIKEPKKPSYHFNTNMISPPVFGNEPKQSYIKHPTRIHWNLCDYIAENRGKLLKMEEYTNITPSWCVLPHACSIQFLLDFASVYCHLTSFIVNADIKP